MVSRLPSAGGRFLRAFAVAVVWAGLLGGVFALLVLGRPAPSDDDEGPFFEKLPRWVERLELSSYDWRARSLGRLAEPNEKVVLVPVDAETLAQARASPNPDVAVRPWPRELLGRLALRIGAEGASTIILDVLLPDASPRGADTEEGSDDRLLRRALEATPASAVLGFGWSSGSMLAVGVPLRPYGLRIGRHADTLHARNDIARVLAERRPPYLLPEGDALEVWAGVEDEGDARLLTRKLALPAPPVVRELTADERTRQMDAERLLASFAEVGVEGLDAAQVAQVRALSPPVASLLGGKAALGGLSLFTDRDGRVRAVPLLVNWAHDDGEVHLLPSAVLSAAMELAGERRLRYANGRLHIGNKLSVPMEPNGLAYVAWDAPEAGLNGQGSLSRSVSAWRLVTNVLDAELGRPAHYRNDLEGRAVVLSDAVEGTLPTVDTPIGSSVARGAVLGQALANLLESRGISRVPARVDAWLTLGLALLGGLAALLLKGWVRSTAGALAYVGVALVLGAAYAGLAHGVFVVSLQWIALAAPLLALATSFAASATYALRADSEARELIATALGRYLRPDIERTVLRDVALMRPERREVSVAFTDIEGFGAMSARLAPEKLAALLNECLTELTELVREQGGQVEYAGDAVRAFWGAPVRQPDHAERACEFALAAHAAMLRKSESWKSRFGEQIRLRIGVATGEVLAGDLGSAFKSNYTVLGEAVSFASRLERANRLFDTRVLVSEAAAAGAGRRFALRELDRVQQGDEPPQRVFELLAERQQLSRERWERLAQYERALALFRARCFAEALPLFEQAATEGDAVAQGYARRAQQFVREPPPANWESLGDLHILDEASVVPERVELR